ncbi:MAG: hypothetical protein FWG90_06785 [Oscillospiraceae bacterium]|nr:hypothetical protein [Oscillospiraceae bacterium]
MEIKQGSFYFIKDIFFEKIADPNLKAEHETTKRPHYMALRDENTNLYWLIPISSKVEKYERIINNKKKLNKPTDGIKIIRIFNDKRALLFQDMFPILEKFIQEPYIKGNQIVSVESQKLILELNKNAKNIINKIHRGVKFTPTQPNVIKIEKIMLSELEKLHFS